MSLKSYDVLVELERILDITLCQVRFEGCDDIS